MEFFMSAPVIVNQVLLQELPDSPCLGLPKPAHLARTVCLRSSDLRNLKFQLEMEHVPDNFFRSDVRVSKMNTIITLWIKLNQVINCNLLV